MTNHFDPCLVCPLTLCDENHSDCFLGIKRRAINRRYYLKVRHNPEYQRKRREAKKRYLSTEKGKKLWYIAVLKYRRKYPEKAREASKRYYEKNKERILLRNKNYKQRVKELPVG